MENDAQGITEFGLLDHLHHRVGFDIAARRDCGMNFLDLAVEMGHHNAIAEI